MDGRGDATRERDWKVPLPDLGRYPLDLFHYGAEDMDLLGLCARPVIAEGARFAVSELESEGALHVSPEWLNCASPSSSAPPVAAIAFASDLGDEKRGAVRASPGV